MRNIARLGIALLGFWILTYVPNLLTYASGMLQYDGLESLSALVSALTPPLVAVLLGLLLVVNRNRLADRLFEDSDIELGAAGPDLLRAGLVSLGVSMIAFAVLAALSTGVFTVSTLVQERTTLGDVPYLSDVTVGDWLPSLLADAARLAIGLFLVLRAEAIARRLWSGRPTRRKCRATCPAAPNVVRPTIRTTTRAAHRRPGALNAEQRSRFPHT